MRVLVACEFSGVVREAFRLKGHDAWSCDLDASLVPGQHIRDDVMNHLSDGWDLMIAHPPCTYLAVSGARWWKGREQLQQEAIDFVLDLMSAPIDKICIENPVGILSTSVRKPDQIIQPWWFGDPESKKTCLWLKNLPLLTATNILPIPSSGRWDNQTPSGQNKLGPSPDRGRLRGITYQGIANAMADQWG